MSKNRKLLTGIIVMMGLLGMSAAFPTESHASQTEWDYGYTGNAQQFTAPYTGTYKLEVWGAQGGNGGEWNHTGGNGGYSEGEVSLTAGQQLYVYVGGQGSSDSRANSGAYTWKSGGYNGGGSSFSDGSSGGGGGATDIRTNSDGSWQNYLGNRIIVAGGGGGAGWLSNGYYGGGSEGGSYGGLTSGDGYYGGGGSQTTGGGAATTYYSPYGYPVQSGSFGQGGEGMGWSSGGGGGGGGYYGGGGSGFAGGSGGGSGYIGGVSNGQDIGGNQSMPAPGGGNEVGQFGNGYAKITLEYSPPTLSLSESPTSYTGGSVTINASSTAYTGASVSWIQLPNGNRVNASSASYTVSQNGTYTFITEDSYGNQVSQSITVSNIVQTFPWWTFSNLPKFIPLSAFPNQPGGSPFNSNAMAVSTAQNVPNGTAFYEGTFNLSQTENVTFSNLWADDFVQVYVDGNPLMEEGYSGGVDGSFQSMTSKTISLAPGEHQVVLEVMNNCGFQTNAGDNPSEVQLDVTDADGTLLTTSLPTQDWRTTEEISSLPSNWFDGATGTWNWTQYNMEMYQNQPIASQQSESHTTNTQSTTAPNAPAINASKVNWTNQNVTFTLSGSTDDQSGVANYQYQIDGGGGNGTTAEGGDGGAPTSAPYYWAKTRYIDTGVDIPVSSISSMTFSATTGGGDHTVYPTSIYVSTDGEHWIYLGDARSNTSNVSPYLSYPLTVTNAHLIQAGLKPTDRIRYIKAYDSYCLDEVWATIHADQTYNLSAGIDGVTGNYGGSWTTYGGTVTISSEGVHSIKAKAIDQTGVASDVSLQYVYIDKTAPNLTVNPSTTNWTNQNVSISANASDGLSGVKQIQLPDGSWVNSSSASYTATQNGTYTFKAEDNAGNITTKSVTVSNIDKTAPSLTLNTNPNTSSWVTGNVVVNATATDDASGIAYIQLPNGDRVSGTSTQYTVSANGTYSFVAVDNAGNQTNQTVAVSNIDQTPPSLSVSANKTNWVSGIVAKHSIEAFSAGDNIWMYSGRGSNQAILKLDGNTVLSGGRGWSMVAIDPSTGKVIKSVNYDTYGNPSLGDNLANDINSLPNGSVVMFAIDDAIGELTPSLLSALESLGLPNASTLNSGGNPSYPLPGQRMSLVYATYKGGSPIFFNYDNTGSTIVSRTGTIGNAPVMLTISGSDSTSGLQGLYYPDGSWTTKSSVTYPVFSNGTYTFQAKDNAGNVTSKSITVSNIDDTLPTLNVSMSTTAWTSGNLTLTATASDSPSGISTVQLPDGSTTVSTSASYTVTQNGTYTFVATDKAGNSVTKTVTVSNIDKTPPTITVTPNITSWTNGDVVLNVSTSDTGSGVKNIQMPDGSWVSGSNASYTVSGNGTYTFTVYDNVGLSATKTVTVSNIDKTAPTSPTISNNTGWTNDSSVMVSIVGGTDSGSGVNRTEYSLSGATSQGWTTYSQPFSVTNEGVTTVSARTIDNTGNVSAVSTSTVKIDRTPPDNTSITIEPKH